MRPDYDPEARAADEAPRKRTVAVDGACRPTSVFLSGLPLTVKDSELQTFLRGCGVLQSIKKVRDRGVFNGCAIVTLASRPCGNQPGSLCCVDGVGRLKFNVHTQVAGAVERALGGRAAGSGAGRGPRARSVRTGSRPSTTTTAAAPSSTSSTTACIRDVTGGAPDFKKRKIAYPGDHMSNNQVPSSPTALESSARAASAFRRRRSPAVGPPLRRRQGPDDLHPASRSTRRTSRAHVGRVQVVVVLEAHERHAPRGSPGVADALQRPPPAAA